MQKREYLDGRIEFIQKFHVLQEIFNFEIEENYSKLNGVVIGAVEGDINWNDFNSVLGNFILLLRYLTLKNKIELRDIELEYQGSRSFFRGMGQSGQEQKFCFYGPLLKKENLDNFNDAIGCMIASINHLKEYFQTQFQQKELEFIWNQEKFKMNTEMILSSLKYEGKKEKEQEWTLNWKIVALNFLMLIYCQEKKEEADFLDASE